MAIALTTSFAFSGPNVTPETDAHAAVTAAFIDFHNQTIQVTFSFGNATVAASQTTAFAKGTPAPLVAQFNYISGAWSASQGNVNASGSLTTAEKSAVLGILQGCANSLQNSAESFAQAHSLLPGTLVPAASGVMQ